MRTIAVIIARAGSKGLTGKNGRPLFGRPLLAYTIDQALAAERLDRVVVSTDWPALAQVAREMGVEVIDRPAELSTDTATVDAPARHAVHVIEQREGKPYDAVMILYGNIPLRPDGLIDASIEKLDATGADSVQSLSPVGKNHPYWAKTLGGPGGDSLLPYQENNIYRRQDLPPVYALNGAILVSKRDVFERVVEGEPHAFLGEDRRAVVVDAGTVVDVDTAADLCYAEAMLRAASGHAGKVGAASEMEVAGRPIGSGQPTYVIAELGVNHDGSVERALELTRAAAEAGADAIKLQLFDPALLLSDEAALADYQKASATDVFDMLKALQLAPADMQPVGELARELGLGFIVTCFDLELVEAMRELGVDAVKVASPDAVNLPLIESLLSLGRPMIISTGTCELEELAPAVMACEGRDLALLHCVSSYPVPTGGAALGAITALRDRFGVPVGYSDHTTRINTGLLAVAAGARIIEKHFTYDINAVGPDHAASFDPPTFKRYIEQIRATEVEIGPIAKTVQDAEREVRRISRQSVCVVRDLPAGHELRREDLTVKRPGTGVPAAKLSTMVGRTLQVPLRANQLLHDEHVVDARATRAAG